MFLDETGDVSLGSAPISLLVPSQQMPVDLFKAFSFFIGGVEARVEVCWTAKASRQLIPDFSIIEVFRAAWADFAVLGCQSSSLVYHAKAEDVVVGNAVVELPISM